MRTVIYCCIIAIPTMLLLSWLNDREKLHDEIQVAEVDAVRNNSPLPYKEVEMRVRERHAQTSWWGPLSSLEN